MEKFDQKFTFSLDPLFGFPPVQHGWFDLQSDQRQNGLDG